MLSISQILSKSLKILLYLTVFNVAVSVVWALILTRSASVSSVSSNFGNLALVEAMGFLLIGGFTDISHTPKMSTTLKLLKIHNKVWTIQESREGERKALAYVMTGVFLMAELLLLLLLNST